MTENMWNALDYLAGTDGPETPNVIGMGIGFDWTGGAQYRSRGPGSKIAGVLTSLRSQGLIRTARRPDGLSGTAYEITPEGRAKLRERDT